MDRMSWTPGVEQKRPNLMPGQLNVDFSVVKIISQLIASWNPPAAATPFTTQRVTIGSFFNASRLSVYSLKICSGVDEALSYLRS